MPKQKDLKRLVRSRMKKTGESYTAARAQITRKKTTRKSGPVVTRPAQLAGMTDAAVRAKTGRTWSQWVRVLDAADAVKMAHRQIATHLRDEHELTAWWAQMVAVGYERIRGLRKRGQRRDGHWECNKTRTYAAPVARLFDAFANARRRARWLPGVKLAVRKRTPNKSMRVTWPDGTHVDVYFVDRETKSSVNIQHQKLHSKDEAARLKTWWSERLDALGNVLNE